MSPDETREQKGTLLIESHEAETDLALIKEKAHQIGDKLIATGEWLKRFADYDAPAIAEVSAKSRGLPTSQMVIEVGQELWTISGRVHELRKRKAALNLK